MGIDAVVTLLVLLFALAAMVAELFSPDFILMAALGLLVAVGIVDFETALLGFANPTLLAIGSLFVVAEGLRRSGVLTRAGQLLLGGARKTWAVLLRLTTTSAIASAFLNNTPVVAMGIPTVLSWARDRDDVSPSKLLIPLSYASIFGGLCTLIGTSTNLVADGLLRSHGSPGLAFFELAKIGLPLTLTGIVLLVFVLPRFLPAREELHLRREDVEDGIPWSRGRADYLFRIPRASKLAGKTVEEAHLRSEALTLVRISRKSGLIAPVGPDEELRGNDFLTFRGEAEAMADVAARWELDEVRLMEPAQLQGPFELMEAVIQEGSRLVGERVSDLSFPDRYGAVVTGVFRHGRTVARDPSRIRLMPGDTLLMEATPGFRMAHAGSQDFYLVGGGPSPGELEHAPIWKPTRAKWGVVILVAVVGLAVADLMHISIAALLGASVMIASGFLGAGEAREAVDWSVLLVIGAALGIGRAMEASGAAEALGRGLVAAGEPLGEVGVLAAMVFACAILTAVITNNAAVALLFPIALSVAEAQALDARPFVVGITVAASMAFATPLGYQTNLMVYGPGGYRFKDFVKVGAPLQLAMGALAVVLIPMLWPFRP